MSRALSFLFVVERALSMKRKEGAFWTVQALIVVGVLALVALPSNSATISEVSSSHAHTSQGSSVSQSTGLAASRAAGLQLVLTLNTTALPFGDAIRIGVDERNALSVQNNVTAVADWPSVEGLWMVGPESDCPTRDNVGYAILPGFFTADNASGVTNEPLEQFFASCPLFPSGTYYLFQPMSDNATFTIGRSAVRAETNGDFDVKGYYLTMDGGIGGDFHPFPPGRYTVVAGDEWGGMVIQHFTVSDPGCQVLEKASPFPQVQSRTFGTLNEPGAWIFWTLLDSTVVFPHGDISVNGSLRNAANESQTVDITFPLLAGMQVLRSNGSVAWTYDSTAATGTNTYPSDMTLSETVDIPSSALQPGQTGTLVVGPSLSDQSHDPLQSDLAVTVELFAC